MTIENDLQERVTAKALGKLEFALTMMEAEIAGIRSQAEELTAELLAYHEAQEKAGGA